MHLSFRLNEHGRLDILNDGPSSVEIPYAAKWRLRRYSARSGPADQAVPASFLGFRWDGVYTHISSLGPVP
jgi:hypothetical protein